MATFFAIGNGNGKVCHLNSLWHFESLHFSHCYEIKIAILKLFFCSIIQFIQSMLRVLLVLYYLFVQWLSLFFSSCNLTVITLLCSSMYVLLKSFFKPNTELHGILFRRAQHKSLAQYVLWFFPQFYIQLVYRPHFGT